MGLDGVPDQQANYAKSGFVWAGETRRFEGRLKGRAVRGVMAAGPDMVASLSEAEARAFGVDKARFNAKWFLETENRKTFAIGGGRAFATVRRCQRGSKIGPLVASDLRDAVHLILHIAAVWDDELIIDVPSGSEVLLEWCEAQGMTVSFGTARMYKGEPPTPGEGVVAVSTLELG